MTPKYLTEYAEPARLALDLAMREAQHLSYTTQTLYAMSIDLAWVNNLAQHQPHAEKIDAFVSRFGRLQDHLGDKALPVFAKLLGAQPKTLLDTLAFAEKAQWLADAEAFVGYRKLRNQLIHEYLTDPSLFLEALRAGEGAAKNLLQIVENLNAQAKQLKLR